MNGEKSVRTRSLGNSDRSAATTAVSQSRPTDGRPAPREQQEPGRVGLVRPVPGRSGGAVRVHLQGVPDEVPDGARPGLAGDARGHRRAGREDRLRPAQTFFGAVGVDEQGRLGGMREVGPEHQVPPQLQDAVRPFGPELPPGPRNAARALELVDPQQRGGLALPARREGTGQEPQGDGVPPQAQLRRHGPCPVPQLSGSVRQYGDPHVRITASPRAPPRPAPCRASGQCRFTVK